jgi:hypothetical protein
MLVLALQNFARVVSLSLLNKPHFRYLRSSPSLVKIHWRVLILECSQECYVVKIWPLDLWPWKSIRFQILLTTKYRYVPCLEDTGSVVCLTTKGRQLLRNCEELKPASHVPILGTILNIFDVFVAVFSSLLNSLNLVERLITSRYLFLCVWIYLP